MGKGAGCPRAACAPGLQFRGLTLGGPRRAPSSQLCQDRAGRCQRRTPDGASALLRVSRSEGPPTAVELGVSVPGQTPPPVSSRLRSLRRALCTAAVTPPAVSSASPAPSRRAKPVPSGWERSSGRRGRQRQGAASRPEGKPPLGLCTAQGHADHRGCRCGRGHSAPPFKEEMHGLRPHSGQENFRPDPDHLYLGFPTQSPLAMSGSADPVEPQLP